MTNFAYRAEPHLRPKKWPNLFKEASKPSIGLTANISGQPYLVTSFDGSKYTLENVEGSILKLATFYCEDFSTTEANAVIAASRISGSPFAAGMKIGEAEIGNLTLENDSWGVQTIDGQQIDLLNLIDQLNEQDWEMLDMATWTLTPDGEPIPVKSAMVPMNTNLPPASPGQVQQNPGYAAHKCPTCNNPVDETGHCAYCQQGQTPYVAGIYDHEEEEDFDSSPSGFEGTPVRPNEEERVNQWRVENLEKWFSPEIAQQIAASGIDWHELSNLIEQGADPNTALAIVSSVKKTANCPFCDSSIVTCSTCGAEYDADTQAHHASLEQKFSDAEGNDLEEGKWYTMHSTKYHVPDSIRITHLGSDEIKAEITSEDKTFPIVITLSDIEGEGYTFAPIITESKRPSAMEGKIARRSFSPNEQKGLINEKGSARNIDKLVLEGTHYTSNSIEMDDSFDIFFLW